MSKSVESSSKTVYVLGAGFSYEANVPLQGNILINLRKLNLSIEQEETDFYEKLPIDAAVHFQNAWEKINKFLDNLFAQVENPSLEDVFTLLDHGIYNRLYCFGYNKQQLEEIRTEFYIIIIILFLLCEQNNNENTWQFYRNLSQYFIQQRLDAGLNNHSFNIISLNWDCILDNSIYWSLIQGNYTNVDIDYCCFTHPFESASRHVPSILQNAKGLYNIKVMKLHGSVNWVICPNCNCLFVGLGAEQNVIYEYLMGKDCCPECKKIIRNKKETWTGPILEPLIIAPTFMKQFDNPHIEYIWHNAYRELSKATKVVFIGYSLPYADYHLRTLLKRAIQPDTEIEIVLVEKDKAPEDSDVRSCYAASRYEEFFGAEKVKIYFGGVKKYFEKII